MSIKFIARFSKKRKKVDLASSYFNTVGIVGRTFFKRRIQETQHGNQMMWREYVKEFFDASDVKMQTAHDFVREAWLEMPSSSNCLHPCCWTVGENASASLVLRGSAMHAAPLQCPMQPLSSVPLQCPMHATPLQKDTGSPTDSVDLMKREISLLYRSAPWSSSWLHVSFLPPNFAFWQCGTATVLQEIRNTHY